MGRGLKWNNPEMWEWCTALHRGGVSYSDIQGRLSITESRRKFGLIEIPSTDTIRRNVNEQARRNQRPLSSLPEDELKDHHGSLVFLAIGIRSYIDDPETLSHGMNRNGSVIAESWSGFSLGKSMPREPKSLVEEEVAESWESFDPREHPRYPQLEHHLQQTTNGGKVIYALGQVYEASTEFIRSRTELLDRIRSSISEVVTPSDEEMNRLHYAIVNALEKRRSGSAEKPLLGRVARVSAEARDAANSLMPSWDESSELVEAVKSIKRLQDVQRLLRKNLGDSIFIRRLIQDGECEICSLDALETDNVE